MMDLNRKIKPLRRKKAVVGENVFKPSVSPSLIPLPPPNEDEHFFFFYDNKSPDFIGFKNLPPKLQTQFLEAERTLFEISELKRLDYELKKTKKKK
jgi:hypothetical protein